jgi:hypothetical protein
MKPTNRDKQLGLASPREYAAIQSGKPKTLLRRENAGLEASHQARLSPEGREEFSLDILLHRMSAIASRVENRRSNCSLPVDIRLGFRLATSVRFGLVLFPVPAHRTGLADFPHPALGKDSRVRPRMIHGPVW